MHKRLHAQRQHIVSSFDTLLFQLHVLSFLLSPSIWGLVCRMFSQLQCSKPRSIDPSRSLRFWFAMVLIFNGSSLWSHASEGAAEGRAVVLDFIGIGYVPSKIQLLCLDFLIIFLQFLLTTIAYETTLVFTSPPDAPDTLLSRTTPASDTLATSTLGDHTKSNPAVFEPPYIMDLRFALIIARLRSPPHILSDSTNTLLPLPNTTPWPLPGSIWRLLRTGGETRRHTEPEPETSRSVGTRVPGAIDTG